MLEEYSKVLEERAARRTKKTSRQTSEGANEWCRRLASNVFGSLLNSLQNSYQMIFTCSKPTMETIEQICEAIIIEMQMIIQVLFT